MNRYKIIMLLSLYNIEIWTDIEGWEGYYKVSNMGRVMSQRKNIIMKPNTVGRGYHKVDLKKEGKRYPKYIHRLVMASFSPKSSYNETVNHINENKKDNRLCNLEWLSDYDNNRYGSHDQSRSKRVIGINIENGYILNFEAASHAANYGFNTSCVLECCKNKYGKKKNIYKKYYWFYNEVVSERLESNENTYKEKDFI